MRYYLCQVWFNPTSEDGQFKLLQEPTELTQENIFEVIDQLTGTDKVGYYLITFSESGAAEDGYALSKKEMVKMCQDLGLTLEQTAKLSDLVHALRGRLLFTDDK